MRVWKIHSWGKPRRLAGAIISYRVFSASLLAVSLGGIRHHIASTPRATEGREVDAADVRLTRAASASRFE
jgi:hypothetical protein